MVRGYQKRIVFLKNTGSKMFEQAYFVLSESAEVRPPLCDDMIAEANRIIDENMSRSIQDGMGFFGKIKRFIKKNIISFTSGVGFGALVCAMLFIIF